MRKLLAALLLCASPAFAQTNGWQEIQNGWSEIQTPPGYSTIPAPSGCAAGLVPYFNASLQLVCSPTVYAPSTDVTTLTGSLVAKNLTASGLATPGAITVTPVLSQIGAITVVAGSLLADGDGLVVGDGAGTVPIEFDASPGDGTTGGAVAIIFDGTETATQIRDAVKVILDGAGRDWTTSAQGADGIGLVRATPGATGGGIAEDVTNAGFLVTDWTNPTAATTYTYRLVWRLPDGTTTEGGTASTTAAGVATLSVANRNDLSWSAGPAGTVTDVYRTVGGATQGKIAAGLTGTTLSDTGLAGGGETAPTVDGTGVVTGDRLVGVATLGNGSTVAKGTGTATATLSGVLYVWVGATATGGTSEETLATYTLPASTLSANGKALRITVWGVGAANANSKTIKVVLGSTVVSQMVSTASAAGYDLQALVVRSASNAQSSRGFASQNTQTGGAGVPTGYILPTTSTETDTSTIAITIKATTPTAAADFTLRGFIVEVMN